MPATGRRVSRHASAQAATARAWWSSRSCCSAARPLWSLLALSDSIAFFVTPSDIATARVDLDKRFRLGGLVVPGSVERTGDDGTVNFELTDQAHEVRVRYRGLLPDLFREGQGIVAQGRLGA